MEVEEQAARGPLTVRIDGPAGAGKTRLGELLCAILVESSMVENIMDPTVHVMGYVDASTFEFIDQLAAKDRYIDELQGNLSAVADERHKAVLYAAEADAVAGVLEARLAEVEGRKIALAVAHGDLSPEQYESRRKIAVEGVRNIAAAARQAHRSRVMQAQGESPGRR